MDKIKIMLVDDQVLLREGLKTIINLQEDMEVVAEAENGAVAIERMKDYDIEVILMDIRMPVLNGVEASGVISRDHSETAIIILTTFDDDDYIVEALANGAKGYLLKDIDALHLVQSIRDAHTGQMMLPSRIAGKLAAYVSRKQLISHDIIFANGQTLQRDALTERELQIGRLLAEGLSNRQIAQQLFLSEGTVKNYISEVYTKLGTNNRTNASMLLKQMIDQG